MALNMDELKPKKFKITLGDQETECNPPRMAHLFMINKIGSVFRDPDKATKEQIIEADQYFSDIIAELIPELNGEDISVQYKLDVLTQITENITPADNKELTEKGVTFDSQSPKAEKVG